MAQPHSQRIEGTFKVFRLRAVRENVHRLCEFALSQARAAGIQEKRLFELEVVLEEILSNIVHHAYRDHNQLNAWMKVGIDSSPEKRLLRIKVEDAGIQFDIFSVASADTNSPLLERPVGGLGVHLVRQLAVNSRYERTPEGLNRLSFEIPIDQS